MFVVVRSDGGMNYCRGEITISGLVGTGNGRGGGGGGGSGRERRQK